MTRPDWLSIAVASLAFIALAGVAYAGSEHNLNGSRVTLGLPLPDAAARGAVAVIEFQNRDVNSHRDDGTFTVDLAGIEVTVTFTWDADDSGADSITIEPPPGYIASPRTLTVSENQVGAAEIYPLDRVGF